MGVVFKNSCITRNGISDRCRCELEEDCETRERVGLALVGESLGGDRTKRGVRPASEHTPAVRRTRTMWGGAGAGVSGGDLFEPVLVVEAAEDWGRDDAKAVGQMMPVWLSRHGQAVRGIGDAGA